MTTIKVEESSQVDSTSDSTSGHLHGGVKRQREDISTPPHHFILPIGAALKKLNRSTDQSICSPMAKMIKTEFSTENIIRVKKEIDLQSSSDDDDDTSSQSGLSGVSSNSGSPSSRPLPLLSTVPNLVQFGAGVFITGNSNNTPSSRPTPSASSSGPSKVKFCFNCKRYGHIRPNCNNRWHYWWPKEYMSRYSWLRRQVFKAKAIRMGGRINEYYQAAKLIDDNVERAEAQISLPCQKQSPWKPMMGVINRSQQLGRQVLRATRKMPQQPGRQSTFQFECQHLIDELQAQINRLRVTLYHNGNAANNVKIM